MLNRPLGRAAGAFTLAGAVIALLPSPSLADTPAFGTAKTQYSGNQSIRTTLTSGGYTLRDPDYDHTNVCTYLGDWASNPCSPLFKSTNVWGNNLQSSYETQAAEALFGVQKATEMFESWFGRSRVFDASSVKFPNTGTINVWASTTAGDSGGTYNSEDGVNLTFETGKSDGTKPSTELDIVAHEMGHALLFAARGFYGGSGEGLQVRALNEATGDIIGTLTEQFAASSSNPDQPDWTIGELMNFHGTGKPIRYLYKPSLDGSSLDCWNPSTTNTNEYDLAGPANKFFYLLSEGSADPDGAGPIPAPPLCNGAPAVQGIQRVAAGQIWYRAATKYFTPTMKYSTTGSDDVRAATLRAATELFGLCSEEYRAVQAAWTASAVAGEDRQCFVNTTAKPIAGLGTAESTISVNLAGTQTTQFLVTPNITYPKSGALTIDLIAPDGTVKRLLSPNSKISAYANVTYPVSGPVTPAGTWKLRVTTNTNTPGTLNGWSIQF